MLSTTKAALLAAEPFIQSNDLNKPLCANGFFLGDALPATTSYFELDRSAFLRLHLESVDAGNIYGDFPDGEEFSAAFIIPFASKQASLKLIAQAIKATQTGGKIIISGDKKLGISSYYKKLSAAFDVIEKNSKAHAIALCITRPPVLPDEMENWIKDATAQEFDFEDKKWLTAPGVFSHCKVDTASQLLVQNLPDITGSVADLGAGWGYCSAEIAKRTQANSIDLYENNYVAIELAKHNLADVSIPTTYIWADLEKEPIDKAYDFVVMNPPFHTGRETRTDLGLKFIEVAHKALKRKGKLAMVANRHLPYEKAISKLFFSYEIVADQAGFKVIWANK